MTQRGSDDGDERRANDSPLDSSVIRALVYLALTLGAGNGLYVASSAQEQYTAAAAEKDQRIVFTELQGIQFRLADYRANSAESHEAIRKLIADHEARIRELERQEHRK